MSRKEAFDILQFVNFERVKEETKENFRFHKIRIRLLTNPLK